MPRPSHSSRTRSMTAPEGSAGAPGAPCSCSAAPSSWTRSTSRWSASRCPRSGADLGLSTSSLQWIVSAYVLGYGGFLLLGGRAADLLGRRTRVPDFPWRVRGCLGCSAAFVDDGSLLIATRFIKGVSAAFTAPAGLSIITTTFAEGRARNKALSIYTATGATGFSLGLVIGGLLTEAGLALGVLPARPRRADRPDRRPPPRARQRPQRARRSRLRRRRRGDDHGRDAAARVHARRGAERRLGLRAHARCRSRAPRSCWPRSSCAS